MARNLVQDGVSIDYLNEGPATVYSGSVVVIGVLVGIAQADIPTGKTGAVVIEKVWRLPKDTATALDAGDAVFWDTADKKIVAASGAGIVPAGVVIAKATAAAITANVKINARA